MILFKEREALKKYLAGVKKNGQTIGFVPTMGALHNGHIALIKESKAKTNVTVCSIFVNPTQFNDPKDFEKYPVTIEKDLLHLEQNGTDVVFLPSVAEIYPEGLNAHVHYDIGYLENILEGFYRPGHFQGVCRVVHKLLDAVQPHTLYMGRKDYQQCMVIRRLIELYNIPAALQIVPTLRDDDGLAMSSRNMRLSAEDRQKAIAIYNALGYIKQHIATASIPLLKAQATQMIVNEGFEKVDYVAICNANTLQAVEEVSDGQPLVALVAAFIGGVRLIDNMLL